MLQKYNKWKVLGVFFENPNPRPAFQLREISRHAGIAPTSVKRYLDGLEKEDLIIKELHRVHKYPMYWANRANENFRQLKKIDMIISIRESGLLDYLRETCMPDAIVLFGSAARGEDLKDSDIDIFLLCKEKKLELQRYENRLKRKISVRFSKSFDKEPTELKNNIINGVILHGYLKVF